MAKAAKKSASKSAKSAEAKAKAAAKKAAAAARKKAAAEKAKARKAAAAAKARGLATVAGAPNVVRGGSHSSNVSAADLATAGILDGLSSDYVPSSLLQAVVKLDREHGIAPPAAIGMVSWRIADMVGLVDRGRLRPGLRADILRFRVLGETPVVTGLWSAGRKVM